MDLNAAQIFATIVDRGSFTAAAAALGMTKATVSRRMADLERHLGVRLLYRSTRQLTLSEEGEQYYQRCRTALEVMAEAELQLSASQHQLTGTLKMAVPIETGQLVLARVVADYLQSHPDLKVDMELTNRVVDPITEGLDCIIRIGESDDTSLVSRRLWLTERLLCASPSYLERVGVPSHPVQLEEHERIFVRSSLLSPRWVFEREGERMLIEPKSRFRVNNITCAREAAKAGLALASLPAMLCREELASGALVPLLSEWRQPPVPIYLLCPERRFMPRKLRMFIDYLIERRDEYAIDRLI